jgi:hypothetical protein
MALAQELGLAANLFWATLEDPETERVLAAAAEEAFGRGAFGVPTSGTGATPVTWSTMRSISAFCAPRPTRRHDIFLRRTAKNRRKP